MQLQIAEFYTLQPFHPQFGKDCHKLVLFLVIPFLKLMNFPFHGNTMKPKKIFNRAKNV